MQEGSELGRGIGATTIAISKQTLGFNGQGTNGSFNQNALLFRFLISLEFSSPHDPPCHCCCCFVSSFLFPALQLSFTASHHFPAPFIIIIPSSPESQDDHLGRLRANPRQWRPTLVGQSIEREEPIWDFLVD
ncbi:hypothetical protein NCS55_00823400 [Fusarium keratoplasticum]|nr:hypothetical protein NCS55_00823400 [Fusarium keratoplasticum]